MTKPFTIEEKGSYTLHFEADKVVVTWTADFMPNSALDISRRGLIGQSILDHIASVQSNKEQST